MARPNRIPEKAAERGVTSEQMVLEALREHGTYEAAADSLNLSFQTLWDYVNPVNKETGKRNPRFKKICIWVDTTHATHEEDR